MKKNISYILSPLKYFLMSMFALLSIFISINTWKAVAQSTTPYSSTPLCYYEELDGELTDLSSMCDDPETPNVPLWNDDLHNDLLPTGPLDSSNYTPEQISADRKARLEILENDWNQFIAKMYKDEGLPVPINRKEDNPITITIHAIDTKFQ